MIGMIGVGRPDQCWSTQEPPGGKVWISDALVASVVQVVVDYGLCLVSQCMTKEPNLLTKEPLVIERR